MRKYLSDEQVEALRVAWGAFRNTGTLTKFAKTYGVGVMTMSQLLRGTRRGDVGGPTYPVMKERSKKIA